MLMTTRTAIGFIPPRKRKGLQRYTGIGSKTKCIIRSIKMSFQEEEERVLVPPFYECDNNHECECADEGVDSDWEWDDYLGFWQCHGCGGIQ